MVQICFWFIHQLVTQILETMSCGNNPLINQKKKMATPYPQDQEKLDLTLSYHM
jgi:hypothetical protein